MLDYKNVTLEEAKPSLPFTSLNSFRLPEWLTVRRVFWFFVILNLVTRMSLVTRPLPYLDGILIPDVAYYTLLIAKNIANGYGPLYTDEHTYVFQPLYAFIMVAAFLWGPDQ